MLKRKRNFISPIDFASDEDQIIYNKGYEDGAMNEVFNSAVYDLIFAVGGILVGMIAKTVINRRNEQISQNNQLLFLEDED